MNATVSDTIAAGNGTAGFQFFFGNAVANLMLVRSVSANNGIGILLSGNGPGVVRVGRSTVTGNASGWVAIGTALQSYGDNQVSGNGSMEGPMPLISLK